MANLPIAGNSSPLPGNTMNAAQAGLPADDPIAGLFAALLAQQTGVDESLLPQPAIAIDGIATDGDTDSATTKNTDELDTIMADTQGDAANGLAAMLLQIPQEPRSHKSQNRIATGDTANILNLPTGTRKAADIAVVKGDDSAEDMADLALDKADINMLASAPGKQSFSDTPAKEMGKHAELTTAFTSQAQPATNTTQLTTNTTQLTTSATHLFAPPAAPANTLAGSRSADNPQTIGTPLTSAAWPGEFSQKIVWMSTQQNQIAELHLNPPDLGPLNVSLKISDNQATALFTSPHGAVRDAIENALPKLREMLADNGIMLGNATVSDQAPHDRNAKEFTGHGSGTNTQRTSGETSGMDDTVSAVTHTRPTQRHHGMVDTFA
ncbi:MAG TPA: flagellar hook-length control protein FliK [Gallionella sp.]|nr:flagellar hook-length control protein FliK [Gallionella sp.]